MELILAVLRSGVAEAKWDQIVLIQCDAKKKSLNHSHGTLSILFLTSANRFIQHKQLFYKKYNFPHFLFATATIFSEE